MIFVIILLFFLKSRSSSAVIYELNATQYELMPKVLHLDPYARCQQDPHAVYCFSEYALVSDQHSPLLDMIKEYSEHTEKHYNHSVLHHGICVTQTCQKYYNENGTDLRWTLEACLNESMSEKYGLKVKILDTHSCRNPHEHAKKIDDLDIIVGVVCVIIILANIIGSLCDAFCEKSEEDRALKFLLCFSITHNWNKLRAPPGDGRDPRLKRLKGLHGIRAVLMYFVIGAHALIISIALMENTEFHENVYKIRPIIVLLNGTMIMQQFLLMSGFLLIYNGLIYAEDHQLSWSMLPKAIIIRWLRLTPSYALILALTATWFGHIASGPLWDRYVALEMNDCRKYWWRHLLYINNYYDDNECMMQAWYLAADTQLYIVALIVFLSCKTARSRKIVLSLLFVAGIIVPAAHVYFQDLDGTLLITPETIQSIFKHNLHYNALYKRGHTNLIGFTVGMAIGYLVYYMHKEGIDLKKYQKWPYFLFYWSLIPFCIACCYSGVIFYEDAPRLSIYVRTVYAMIVKPLFIVAIGTLVTGMMMKFEGFYRHVVEWSIWTPMSRLTYSAYLMHLGLIKSHLGYQTTMTQTTMLSATELSFSIIAASFLSALVFYLLVEAPVGNIIKECLKPKKQDKEVANDKSFTVTVKELEPQTKL